MSLCHTQEKYLRQKKAPDCHTPHTHSDTRHISKCPSLHHLFFTYPIFNILPKLSEILSAHLFFPLFVPTEFSMTHGVAKSGDIIQCCSPLETKYYLTLICRWMKAIKMGILCDRQLVVCVVVCVKHKASSSSSGQLCRSCSFFCSTKTINKKLYLRKHWKKEEHRNIKAKLCGQKCDCAEE